ncbi:MAG: HD-GYP domain-containing protein [Thermodesulfobacteriota bacterium]
MSEKPIISSEDLSTRMGTEFIVRFFRILKGAQIYDRNNEVVDQYAQEILQTINSVIQTEGHLFFKIVRDYAYFNNIKIQVRADHYPLFKGFLNELKKRWIGEIEFTDPLDKETLKDFVYLLSELEENNESNYIYVKRQLEYRGIRNIEIGKLEVFKDEEIFIDSEDRKRNSKEVYFKSIQLVKEMMENVKNQRLVNIRKAKRLMQNAVNAILRDDSTLLGLANIKNYDEYTFNHSVNVAIYAIAIGQRIGIPKKHLSHLGMAGLFHDIGKTKIPKEILNKEGKLSPEEWQVIRSHPIVGAELVMKMKEWGELSTRMIDGSFEHHLRYDLSGYPKLSRKRRVSLFGRIIALSDFYDALGRPRVYNRFPYVSEKILGLMMERSGKDFDPILVKVFINMIGIYPLGTLVLLNTNEMGVVIQIQEDPEMIDRPKVSLIYYSEGEYRKGKIVDLTEKDEKTGEYKRTIVKTLDPNEYNINVAEFLI